MDLFKKNTFCSWCGTKFAEQNLYPRQCFRCSNDTYINPIPVTCAMIPVWDDDNRDWGMLVQKRSIEPKKGMWALPGGYLNINEAWQRGCAREVLEEIGLETEPENYELYSVNLATNSNLLIFGLYKGVIHIERLNCFQPNEECSEILLAKLPMELAFPTHTLALNKWFMSQ